MRVSIQFFLKLLYLLRFVVHVELVQMKCTACRLEVRFQDYESGIHNFNNEVLLTLNLCEQAAKEVKVSIFVSFEFSVGSFLSLTCPPGAMVGTAILR